MWRSTFRTQVSFSQSFQNCCRVSTFLASEAEGECTGAKVLRRQRRGSPNSKRWDFWCLPNKPHPALSKTENSHTESFLQITQNFLCKSWSSAVWIIQRQILVGENNPLVPLTEPFVTVSPSLLILVLTHSLHPRRRKNEITQNLKTHFGFLDLQECVNQWVNKLLEQEGTVWCVLPWWGVGRE